MLVAVIVPFEITTLFAGPTIVTLLSSILIVSEPRMTFPWESNTATVLAFAVCISTALVPTTASMVITLSAKLRTVLAPEAIL